MNPVKPLSDEQATDIESQLALRYGVMVRPVIDFRGTVHLHPERKVDTHTEVYVLRAFHEVTDSPLMWHPAAVDDTIWTVPR